jgi:tetratricopeptide (TPR) repeat protein
VRVRRALVSVCAALAITSLAFFVFSTRRPTPALPRLETLGTVAPEVAESARQALASLAEDRRDANRWGRFGMVCEANGLIGAARDAYEAATTVSGTEAKWWYRLAFVQARSGRMDDAVSNIRRAIALDDTYAPAQWRLGLWLLDRDDTVGAERAFARAGELNSSDVSAAAGLARVYLQRGQNQQAADALERALARTPGDRYAMQLLGTAYRRLGRADDAEFALAVGETGEPAWADPWTDEMLQFRRGFAVRLKDATQYFVAGRMAEAIALLQQLRQERPDDIALQSHLGEVYVAAGRASEGTAMLEQVVAKDPNRFEAFVNLASGYLKQGDLVRARAAIDRALAIDSTLGRAHETRGLILWRAGDERAALEAFKAATRWDPRAVQAFVWAGMVDMNLNRPADALERFGDATRRDPTRVDAWVGVANASMTLGAWDRAAAALQHAAQLNPDAPDVKQAAEHLRGLRR